MCALRSAFACSEQDKRPIGGSCGDKDDCVSGVCGGGLCLDPASDDDRDGIINGVEAVLGSDPTKADTDDDGSDDGDEVTADLSGTDTDEDGKPDVVESSTQDTDGDCIPDQYDAQDEVANSDLSPLAKVVCTSSGPCATQRDVLSVTCATGTATCVYARVAGYADPEVTCDGIDENCDGDTDEGFPVGCVDDDWDDDGVVDVSDVCPEVANPGQADADADGVGDACAGQYELVFAEPLPAPTIVAGQSFPVVGAIQRKAAAGQRPAPPPYSGEVELGSLPDEAILGTAVAATQVVFEDVALTLVGTSRLTLTSALGSTTSEPIAVTPGALSTLEMRAAETSVAGEALEVNAEAQDRFGNRVDFDGAATFTTTDAQAEIPDGAVFVDGQWTMSGLVLKTAGEVTLNLGAATVSGSTAITVTASTAADLALTLDPSVKAGVPATVTVTALDAFGNTASDYAGNVGLAKSDARAELAASVALVAGLATVEATFGTIGDQTIAGTGSGALAGMSDVATTNVLAGQPHAVAIVAPDAVAGVASLVRVTIVDSYGQVADDPNDSYFGSVSFDLVGTQPSALPTLPGATTFSAADRSSKDVSVTWSETGTWILRATGTQLAVPSATDAVLVSTGLVAALAVSLPVTARAGVTFDLTVTAVDVAGNRISGFVGTVALSADDDQSNLPTLVDFAAIHAGRRTLQVIFGSLGLRTVTATSDGLSGTAETTVSAGSPAAIALTQGGTATTGTSHDVHVAIVDAFGNVAATQGDSFVGNVSFAVAAPVPDPAPTLPGPTAFVAGDLSEQDVATTWFRSGTWTLRAVAPGLTEGTLAVVVTPGVANGLDVSLPATAKADVAVTLQITARDASGNIDEAFVGTVTLLDDDPRSNLPDSVALTVADRGTRPVQVVFGTVGARTVSATVGALLDEATTTVRAGVPDHLVLTVTNPAAVGVADTVRVAAVDRFGNVAKDPATPYLGTVTFDVSGTVPAVAPLLPTPVTFVAANLSERDITTTWRSPGAFTLRATGTVLTTAIATVAVVVTGSATTQFRVALPDTTRAGVPVAMTVSARDALGALDPAFVGTVALSSDDAASNLPATLVFAAADAGTKTLQVTFNTLGSRTVTATLGTATGNNTITVESAATVFRISAPTTMVAGTAPNATLEAVDAQGVVDTAYNGMADVSGAGPSLPLTITFVNGVKVMPLTLTVATSTTLAVSDGVRSGGHTILVTNAAPSALRTQPAGDFVRNRNNSVAVTVLDAYGNIATNFLGSMVAALGGPGVVNGPLVYTAIDAGVKSFSVRYTAAGAYGLTFTSATTSISVLLEVTVFSDVPSRISTRRTPTSAQWSVKVPVASFEVSLTDADGLLAVSDTPVAVTLALGTQKPRPARLTGTTELTFAPGESRIVLRDDLVITKPGVYSIEGRADGYELGALEDFAAYYRSPVVTFDGFELEADNCVRVDYTVTQPDNVPVDVFVRIGDGGDVYATQAAASSDVAGTYRLQSGSHSFLWNAPNDIGTLSGDLTVSARVNDDRMLHSPVGALRGFALSFKQGLVIEDRPGPAERTRDVGVGQFDGDSIGDVAYSTERAVHIAFSDDTFLQTTPDHAGYGQLDVADMDFDGESEIAVVDGAQIAFLSGSAQPLGGFTPCVGSSPVDVVFGNFDGRDALDLAVLCDTGTGFAAELYRKSSGWTRFARVTGAGAPRAIAVADLQRDGRNDLLIGTALGISSLLARTVAAPQYVDFNAAQSLAGPPIERLAVGETTNDIYIDVVAVHDDGTASQFSSTGNDLDPLALRGDVAVAGARDVLLADADGDGNRDDIFSTDGETYFVRRPFYGDAIEVSAPAGIDRLAAGEGIVVGAGTGSAGTPFSYLRASAPPVCQRRVQALQPTPPWHDVASLTVDDMNDDGKLDIIGAGRLALGRGDGSFAPDYRAIGADPDARITTGDFNGDGLRDYVRSLNGSLGLYVRKPEVIPLGFEPIGMLTLGLDDVAVDDMDGDGRDDIVFVDEQSYLAVAYQTASTGTTGVFDIEQVVQLGSVGLFRDLAIGDLDSRGGLDIAYVKIDEVAPGDLQHSLCTLVSQQYRGYLAPSCTRLDAGLDFAARSALRIEDLAIDQSLYCARSAFYRYEPGLNSGHLEARALGVEGPQAANVIDICPGGRPFSYAFGGLFDSLVSISVVASDVVATCLVDGNTNVGVWLRNADPFSFTAISVEPGASPIALRDFDGDPLPELATSQGTVDLDTSDGISGTKPTYVSAFNDGDVDATLNGDFSGRGFEELVAVSIYDASDTYLQVDLFHTSAPGASTWSTRVCSDCPQGRQWRVRTERGDIDGDGRDDIVIAYGTDGEDATLVVLKVDASGNLAQIASPLGGDLGVTSFELAVGRVLPGSRADIVVVGTRMAIGELFIVHYEDNAWREYGRSNATVIPRDTPSIAIGDFRVRGKGEIAIVDGQQIVLFGAGDCSATSSCFAEQHRLVTVGPDSNMGRTRLATIPGDRVDDLAVLATLISEGSTSLLVMVKSWDDVAGVLVSSLLAQRDYDGYSCADGYDEPCVPSAFGPYVADFDRDGALDVFIGWRDGMTWEAFTANGRVLVAASDDHRAAFANVFDVDRSGFPDIIIFDAALPDALWQMTR